MRKLPISIGIPVFNEEANIRKLLESLLAQKRVNFSLKEIIVVSDSSTDRTVEEIKSVKSSKIILVKNKKRLGQAGGQNKIVKLFRGEVLVLLNGDVLPENENFISELIKPLQNKQSFSANKQSFSANKNVGLAGPRIVPVRAKTFFEEIINFSIKLKEVIFESHNKGNNIYLCSGRGRAFSKELAKEIVWKEALSEDAYSYLFCLEKGYKFKYVPKARLLFKSPDNFKDHIKQSARFMSGSRTLFEFGDDLVKRSYKLPYLKAAKISIAFFITNPGTFLSYIAVLLLIKLNPNKERYANSKWQASFSSKVLN